LQGLAGSSSLQQADLSSDNTRKLLHEMYLQINNITTADRLFILNKNDIVMINLVPEGQKTFVDINVSNIDWVRETRTQHKLFDIKSQYLAVLDQNSDQLIHPVNSLIGKPFFGNYTQQVTGHNKALNRPDL
jgi:hypothetical protein